MGDDQNIYGFQGSDSADMKQLMIQRRAVKYELITNYHNRQNIMAFTNAWASIIRNRLKSEPEYAEQVTKASIRVTEYACWNLVVPVVENINAAGQTGSTCVLTRTN